MQYTTYIGTVIYNILLFISINNILFIFFTILLLMDHITLTSLGGSGIFVKKKLTLKLLYFKLPKLNI